MLVSIEDLEKIREEFEKINRSYRTCFSHQERLDLLERVKRLLATIKHLEE